MKDGISWRLKSIDILNVQGQQSAPVATSQPSTSSPAPYRTAYLISQHEGVSVRETPVICAYIDAYEANTKMSRAVTNEPVARASGC